jgi:hypothetical protein
MHIFAKFVSDLIFLQNRDKLNIKKFCMSELPSTGHIKEGPPAATVVGAVRAHATVQLTSATKAGRTRVRAMVTIPLRY